MQETPRLIQLWDLPTRLFHWLLLVLVMAAFFTGLSGGNLMAWHGRLGLAILGLLVFRLIWGLIGSTYARFSQFVRGPTVIVDYLHGRWHGIGHNPLGALSVLALLGLLLCQVASGLFADDDIAFQGSLTVLVSTETSIWLTRLHRQSIWIIGALIALHVGAVLWHALIRKENLIKPMLNGRQAVSDPTAQPARGGYLSALLFALALSVLVVWIADGGLLSSPPAPASLPNW